MKELKKVKRISKSRKPAKSKKSVNLGGRPSKYVLIESRLDELEKLAKYGLTDAQLADFFNINRDTLSEYKKKHPNFSDTLKRGKLIADTNVIDSFYKKAIGFEYDEIMQEGTKDAKGEIKIKTVKKTKKCYPPDTAACFIWLKNRAGWKDKQEIEHSGGVKIIRDNI